MYEEHYWPRLVGTKSHHIESDEELHKFTQSLRNWFRYLAQEVEGCLRLSHTNRVGFLELRCILPRLKEWAVPASCNMQSILQTLHQLLIDDSSNIASGEEAFSKVSAS